MSHAAESVAKADAANTAPPYTAWQLTAYALKLGAFGFGGPVALVGYMRRDLVERRRWISEAEYNEGLTLAQLAPGPLAAQLAIYLGYVHHRLLGATLVGVAFVLPSFLMVLGIAWAYVKFGGLPWMQAAFYGVGACVIGIITNSTLKLVAKSAGKNRLFWALGSGSALITAVSESEFVSVFVASGVIAWLVMATPAWLSRPRTNLVAWPLLLGAMTVPTDNILWQLFLFFTKAGALVFGSGLAIVPFLHGGVVRDFHWLNEQQFIDAVAVAMLTPGPVVITVAFIGYLVAGLPGACVAAIATFLPCYLITVSLAPSFKLYAQRPGVVAFIQGVTISAVGAIAGAVFVLGKRSVFDVPTVTIAVATLLACWKLKKIPEPLLVLLAALIGLALK